MLRRNHVKCKGELRTHPVRDRLERWNEGARECLLAEVNLDTMRGARHGDIQRRRSGRGHGRGGAPGVRARLRGETRSPEKAPSTSSYSGLAARAL